VDVFVRKLRSKLQRHSPNWEYIHTHFGVGYRFEAEPTSADAGSLAGEAVADPGVSVDVAPVRESVG
jgi:DNA-binding winged helix-turn-helix (wHTH) protein